MTTFSISNSKQVCHWYLPLKFPKDVLARIFGTTIKTDWYVNIKDNLRAILEEAEMRNDESLYRLVSILETILYNANHYRGTLLSVSATEYQLALFFFFPDEKDSHAFWFASNYYMENECFI